LTAPDIPRDSTLTAWPSLLGKHAVANTASRYDWSPVLPGPIGASWKWLFAWTTMPN